MVSNERIWRPHTVTFDCWSTLLAERSVGRGHARRVRMVAETLGISEPAAERAFGVGWREHQVAWHRRTVCDGPSITARMLKELGIQLDEQRTCALVTALEEEALKSEVAASPGARTALETLARAGVRRALICDTGFTPGRVVRQLLDRVGLLAFLEVTIFSDEVGVPKPHPKVFAAALDALGARSAGAVHVGDLRRSDVAGARAHGMGSVRYAALHDDGATTRRSRAGVIDCRVAGCSPPCETPEADAIAWSYQGLLTLLGYA